MKLPGRKVKRTPAHQRQTLALWLQERALDALLDIPEDCASSAEPFRYDPIKFSPSPGEVFLLRPAIADAWGPVYVLILEPSDAGSWLVAPFGRYSVPAVPGEWRTGLSSEALKVLCLWNHRKVPARAFLAESASKVSSATMSRVKRAFLHVVKGDPLDAASSRRLGPPLVHPADPRYEYLAEERKRLDDHIPRVDSGVGEIENVPLIYLRASSAWLLAAEGRPAWPE
ncbi:MAG TPA: hypothetical protein PJ991_03485 [Kiritimatiellia bacterium]|nr:hypothetical protein [Kiritimatiellia bacterium]